MNRYHIIYGASPEALMERVGEYLSTPEGVNWETTGGPFQDSEGRRWGQAVRLRAGTIGTKPGEIKIREKK